MRHLSEKSESNTDSELIDDIISSGAEEDPDIKFITQDFLSSDDSHSLI